MPSERASPSCSATRPTRPSSGRVGAGLTGLTDPSGSSDLSVDGVAAPGEGGTEEIGNMIQSYIKEIEDLR